MKRTLTTMLTAGLISLFCFTMVIYSSCSKIECIGKTCQHSGACDKGKCKCTSSYEGESCENALNKKFVGAYYGVSSCGGSGPLNITAGAEPTRINFSDAELGNIYATVSANSITIPSQTFYYAGVNYAVSGSGTLSGNSLTLSTFSQDLTNGGAASCVFTGNK